MACTIVFVAFKQFVLSRIWCCGPDTQALLEQALCPRAALLQQRQIVRARDIGVEPDGMSIRVTLGSGDKLPRLALLGLRDFSGCFASICSFGFEFRQAFPQSHPELPYVRAVQLTTGKARNSRGRRVRARMPVWEFRCRAQSACRAQIRAKLHGLTGASSSAAMRQGSGILCSASPFNMRQMRVASPASAARSRI